MLFSGFFSPIYARLICEKIYFYFLFFVLSVHALIKNKTCYLRFITLIISKAFALFKQRILAFNHIGEALTKNLDKIPRDVFLAQNSNFPLKKHLLFWWERNYIFWWMFVISSSWNCTTTKSLFVYSV